MWERRRIGSGGVRISGLTQNGDLPMRLMRWRTLAKEDTGGQPKYKPWSLNYKTNRRLPNHVKVERGVCLMFPGLIVRQIKKKKKITFNY